MTAVGMGQWKASDRDRDATLTLLRTAFAEGRLDRDEHDERVGRALSSRTYAELDAVTADLPGRYTAVPATRDAGPPRVNPLAVAALVCGAAQPFTAMLSTIPAIVLGHMARGQIRRSGDRGGAMATCGLALGWAGLAAVLLVALLVAVVFAHLASVILGD